MGFIILVIFGVICAVIADSKGRSGIGWFFIGCFFPVIGLILICVLSDLAAVQERDRRLQTENLRLREKLRKDRQVADGRHQTTQARLGAHDRALGVDTAQRLEPPDPSAHLAPPPMPGQDPAVMTVDWFFVDEGNRRGPITFATLREHWERGDLQLETLVWCRGQVDWLPLRDRIDLQEALLA